MADGEQALLGLANGLLVTDACRRRGDLARAIAHLGRAQVHLLRLARLAEHATDEWVAPERGLAADISAAAYARYADATAWLEATSIRQAVDRSWRWGRELAANLGIRPLSEEALAALDYRLLDAPES